MPNHQRKKSPQRKKRQKPPLSDYVRYTGLGFTMMALILIGLFGGMKLDSWLELEFPVFMLCGTLGGFAVSMWYLFRTVLKK